MIPYDPDGSQRRLFVKRLKTSSNVENMAVDGSVTNVSFELAPSQNEIYRIAQWNIYIEDGKGFNVTSYGSNGLLTNGMQVKGVFGGVEVDLLPFTIKSNGDIISVTYDVNLLTFGNDSDVLVANWDITKMGQFLRLDGSQGDKLKVVVRDNMTFLNKQYILVKGYIE